MRRMISLPEENDDTIAANLPQVFRYFFIKKEKYLGIFIFFCFLAYFLSKFFICYFIFFHMHYTHNIRRFINHSFMIIINISCFVSRPTHRLYDKIFRNLGSNSNTDPTLENLFDNR